MRFDLGCRSRNLARGVLSTIDGSPLVGALYLTIIWLVSGALLIPITLAFCFLIGGVSSHFEVAIVFLEVTLLSLFLPLYARCVDVWLFAGRAGAGNAFIRILKYIIGDGDGRN